MGRAHSTVSWQKKREEKRGAGRGAAGQGRAVRCGHRSGTGSQTHRVTGSRKVQLCTSLPIHVRYSCITITRNDNGRAVCTTQHNTTLHNTGRRITYMVNLPSVVRVRSMMALRDSSGKSVDRKNSSTSGCRQASSACRMRQQSSV